MIPPVPTGQTGWRALRALIEQKDILAALPILHQDLGDVFALPVPNFNAVMLVGAEANQFIMTGAGDALRWRIEKDPLVRLLRNGFLVEDGARHDTLRSYVAPAFHRQAIPRYVECMWQYTDRVRGTWRGNQPLDLFPELRKIALYIISDTLFGRDLSCELDRLWSSILRTVSYISPGLWILWPHIPRPGYARARSHLDQFLYGIISARRNSPEGEDLLCELVRTPGLSDDLIRDQLVTLLIAGHDTSTALLAWAIYLLGQHPAAMQRASAEVDTVLDGKAPTLAGVGRLHYLDQVIKEALRLYPPIHIGNRIAAQSLEFKGYTIPKGTRVLFSIYLTHRDSRYWTDPDQFQPERFSDRNQQTWPAFAYVPFGGGPRTCVGATFAQVEAKVVLARLLQAISFQPEHWAVRPRMRATLIPHPGLRMRVFQKD